MMATRSKALLAGIAISVAAPAFAEEFRFVALGDIPYGEPETVYPAYEALIDAINMRAPSLVIHVGDTKSGSTVCSDKLLDEQRAYLDSFDSPTLYTPGDNEWTDCHRKKAGGFDVLERLDHIRRTYFDAPATSFGQKKLALTHQGDEGFPENVRVMLNGVMFVTTHVVGSNNGFEPRSAAAVAEFFERDAANVAWLEESFDSARNGDADAVVLAFHADMFEFDFGETGKGKWLRHSGFRTFGKALRKLAKRFDKPVLLVFGDSHRHRAFRPFPKKVPELLAVEVFGGREMHAVEIVIRRETDGSIQFDINPLLNPTL